MPIAVSIPLADHSAVPAQPARELADKPPTLQFVLEFFAGHKAKIVLVGAGAILAGLGLIVVDLFTAGVVAPVTAHLVFGLFSFGVAAIGVGVTAKFLSGELSEDTKKMDGSVAKKTIFRPRGKRCNRTFQERHPQSLKVPVPVTDKGRGANQ